MHSSDYPKVIVTINRSVKFCSLDEAARLQDAWFDDVEVGDMILNEDFSTRQITREEIDLINEMCDEYSASK